MKRLDVEPKSQFKSRSEEGAKSRGQYSKALEGHSGFKRRFAESSSTWHSIDESAAILLYMSRTTGRGSNLFPPKFVERRSRREQRKSWEAGGGKKAARSWRRRAGAHEAAGTKTTFNSPNRLRSWATTTWAKWKGKGSPSVESVLRLILPHWWPYPHS